MAATATTIEESRGEEAGAEELHHDRTGRLAAAL